jgi:hypothetical protein
MSAVSTITKEERAVEAAKHQAEALGYDTERMRCYVIPFHSEDMSLLARVILAMESGRSPLDFQPQYAPTNVWTVCFLPISRPGFFIRGGDIEVYVHVETGEVVKYLQGQ